MRNSLDSIIFVIIWAFSLHTPSSSVHFRPVARYLIKCDVIEGGESRWSCTQLF